MKINGDSLESLTFASQGSEYSFHAEAARQAAPGMSVQIEEHHKFGEVIRASRSKSPGLGVIAIRTVVGTVDASAAIIVTEGAAALPPIKGRVDLEVELALIGSRDQDIEELAARRGVVCLAQKPAWLQCVDGLRKLLPWVETEFRSESTAAIEAVIEEDSLDLVAIGPSFAAEPLGGVILGPPRLNPPNSVTSFYVMQRNPNELILPTDPHKTEDRTVISIAYPKGNGEFDKCMEVAKEYDLKITRFIPYNSDDPEQQISRIRSNGGLVEVAHDMFDEEVTTFCARVQRLRDANGDRGDFVTHRLGMYPWYPEPVIDPFSIDGTAHLPPHTEVPRKTLI